jgi:L-lactate dehydrogenase complex protein LldG
MNAIFDTFKLRAEAVSAEVHHFPNKTEALDFITGYLQSQGVADTPQSYPVWADCPFLNSTDKQHLSQAVPGLTFEVTREKAAASKIGISQGSR